MPERETDETNADWHPDAKPNPDARASRWSGFVNAARGLGERAKETAQIHMDKAADLSKNLAGKAAETGAELKERALDALKSERGQQAKEIALRVLDTEIVYLVPFAETLAKGGMAIAGKDLRGNELSSGDRLKLGAKAAAWGAVDFFTFGEGHVLAEGGRLAKMAKKLQEARRVKALTAAGREFFGNNVGVLKQFADFLEQKGSQHATALKEAAAILEQEQKH